MTAYRDEELTSEISLETLQVACHGRWWWWWWWWCWCLTFYLACSLYVMTKFQLPADLSKAVKNGEQ